MREDGFSGTANASACHSVLRLSICTEQAVSAACAMEIWLISPSAATPIIDLRIAVLPCLRDHFGSRAFVGKVLFGWVEAGLQALPMSTFHGTPMLIYFGYTN